MKMTHAQAVADLESLRDHLADAYGWDKDNMDRLETIIAFVATQPTTHQIGDVFECANCKQLERRVEDLIEAYNGATGNYPPGV